MEKKQQDFMNLYEPVHENFVRYCNARAHGIMEAEDLVSESVLAAYEHFERIKNKDAFLYYLFGIAKRVVINKLRRKKFSGAFDWDQANNLVQTGDNPEEKVDVRHLYEAMAQLPDKQREALILFEISGFSLKEIQDIQNSGLSAVKARLKRGRTKLAELLRVDEIKNEPIHERSKILASLFF